MLRLVIVVCLALAVTAAPLQKVVEKQQTLSRVKRADERVLFGNLQNNARVKKVDMSVPLKSEEADLDKKATMEADIFPAEDSEHNEPLDTPEADNNKLTESEEEIESELTAPLQNEQQAEKTDNSQEENDSENTSKEQESASIDNLAEDENTNKDSITNSDEINTDQDESSGEDVNDALKNILDEYNEYYNYRDYFPQIHQRGKRGASTKTVGFTAEDMSMGKQEVKKNSRVKRDLTEDALRAFLEEEDTSDRQYDPDLAYREELARLVAQDPEVEELLEDGYPIPEEMSDGSRERYPIENADFNYQLSDDELEEERARLILLKYFYENPEMLNYLKLDTDDTDEDYISPPSELSYPAEVKRSSSWDGLDYANRQDYKPIVYEGQPGIFIPVKRQLITMLPGQRKRSFYPYEQEPEGHWGAFVPDQQKRNRQEYERLYRLARALKRNPDWDEF